MNPGRHVHVARLVLFIVAALAVASCAGPGAKDKAPAPAAPAAVRPQDDMFRAVNADWLANTEIPADRAAWGGFAMLRDQVLMQSARVIEEADKAGTKGTADQQKISALYASFMDEGQLEGIGVNALEPELRAIDAIKSKAAIPGQVARFNALGVTAPFVVDIDPDKRDPKRYLPTLYQSGLGLPDRDYYLRDDDPKLKDTRDKYVVYIARMLTLLGAERADGQAQQVLELETRLARAQWTRVESRDPVKTYNRVVLGKLDAITPGFPWKGWLANARVAGRIDALGLAQPSYFTGMGRAVDEVPLATWKAYFRFHLANAAAPYLSKDFVDAHFAFNSGVLAGTPTNLPRWKRGVNVVGSSIGEGLGKLYVAMYFPPENKARMDAMVRNLRLAFQQSIDTLEWMGPATRQEAQAKLAKFNPKVGYPTKWRDYTALKFRRDDLLGNVWRARQFEFAREMAKLGKPIDRSEWGITPQTVNAYYSGSRNEIVFPAGILQPPFFDPAADDAMNYGAIGAIIGHEMSHGFDDKGSQSDGDGRLRNWWTDEDRARFDAKTKALVAQYDAFEPVPGYHVNGALTLGENIADNSGLAIALKAYRLSLQGKPGPVIDGVTAEQRFYRGFASSWRGKVREPLAIRLIKSDPHSPSEFRVNGSLRNQAPFYEAFGVKPGDGMYLPPEQRVVIW